MSETTLHKIQIPPDQVAAFCRQARKDAGNDSAAGDYSGWKSSLQNIAQEVARQMGLCFNDFRDKCVDAAKKASEAEREIKARLVPDFVRAVEVDATKRMAEVSPILDEIGKTSRLIGEYHKRFPNLAGGAVPTHAPNKAFFVGFVIFLIAIESFANSRLFAEADDFGLVGGALLAVLVSCINVLPILFAGILATKSRGNIGFPPWVWRTICAVAFLYAVGVNAVIWVLRNNKIIEANGVVDQSQSVVLFVIGMVIAGISFYKGWGFADLYGKFRECQERMDANKKHYSREILSPISSARSTALSAQESFVWEIDQLKKTVDDWYLNSPLIARDGVAEVSRVWQKYHGDYAPLYQGQSPSLPNINDAEIAKEMDVHIHDAWDNYAEKRRQYAEKQTGVANDLLPAFGAVRQELVDLEKSFVSVITAKINNVTM